MLPVCWMTGGIHDPGHRRLLQSMFLSSQGSYTRTSVGPML